MSELRRAGQGPARPTARRAAGRPNGSRPGILRSNGNPLLQLGGPLFPPEAVRQARRGAAQRGRRRPDPTPGRTFPDVDVKGRVKTVGAQKPRRVVIHTTETPDAKGTRDMRNILQAWRPTGLGSHIIVDREGRSARNASFNQTTQAAAGANDGTIHIEQVGRAATSREEWKRNRKPQLDETARWLALANVEHGVPLRRGTNSGVAPHASVGHSDHWDPGPGFPMDDVIRQARRYAREMKRARD